ncbi:hypothetical protein BC938DRAFT_471502 [Jimgerdemannia flammicorona]|uniref:Uncharacterized protein n=1 Tax=Jimgerdemannia flammicorona TaxID=994334 RepID=A0A433Q7Y5_9FUNG|nr:hypothetical protein BC938DRAFT_471502 [Jimgerdemannia flammicorona]
MIYHTFCLCAIKQNTASDRHCTSPHLRQRKDAERLAALDACEKLDARGMLRNNVDVDSEMYGDDDSDEDNFYDRTERGKLHLIDKITHIAGRGVGKASKQKIKGSKAGASVSNVETYDSLVAKKQELTPRIKELQEMIIHADEQEKSRENVEGDDELDSYMQQISTVAKGVSKSSLQKELQTLQKEDQRLERLIKLTKPSDIFAKPVVATAVEEQSEKPSKLVNNAIIAGTALTAVTSSTIVPTSFDSMPPSSPASKRKSSTGDTGLTEGRTIDEEEHPDQPARPKRRKPMIPMTREEYLQEADETEAVDTWVPPEEQSGR